MGARFVPAPILEMAASISSAGRVMSGSTRGSTLPMSDLPGGSAGPRGVGAPPGPTIVGRSEFSLNCCLPASPVPSPGDPSLSRGGRGR